jgi:hypothetical protein
MCVWSHLGQRGMGGETDVKRKNLEEINKIPPADKAGGVLLFFYSG